MRNTATRIEPRKKTRQQLNVKRNNDALSRNHCRSGIAISIIHSEFVIIDFAIHTMCMRHIANSGLPGFTNLVPHYIAKDKVFFSKK